MDIHRNYGTGNNCIRRKNRFESNKRISLGNGITLLMNLSAYVLTGGLIRIKYEKPKYLSLIYLTYAVRVLFEFLIFY